MSLFRFRSGGSLFRFRELNGFRKILFESKQGGGVVSPIEPSDFTNKMQAKYSVVEVDINDS